MNHLKKSFGNFYFFQRTISSLLKSISKQFVSRINSISRLSGVAATNISRLNGAKRMDVAACLSRVNLATSISKPYNHVSSLSFLFGSSSNIATLPLLTRSVPLYNQTRNVTYGREYQPNTLKRKRSVGFLARLKSIGGRKILKRRMMKGRKHLTH